MTSYDPASPSTARREVLLFLLLTLALSCVGWTLAIGSTDFQSIILSTLFTMWCPGIAAILTRLYVQRNLKGFGFRVGDLRWPLVGIFLPIAVGLLMFGAVWVTGVGAFDTESASTIFSLAFVPAILATILLNLFAAAGEEIGWRGLLVPEMAKFMGFTELALLSGGIWTAWHFPMILFSTYHGTGPLWFSIAVFIPSVIGAGLVLAWLTLKSGSVVPAILFHGFWNYFIQQFYPALTVQTAATELILGEFGWASPAIYVILALIFWHYRGLLPVSREQNAGN